MRMRLFLAWRTLRHNRRQTIAVFLLSACAMALLLVASFLGNGVRGGLIAAVEPFDLLAGNGGSYQMVINTVFLQDYPAGNVPYEMVETLRADARVAAAVPLAFGDNYRGYRVVGTERGLFDLPAGSRPGSWLRLREGGLFSESGREAVVGAAAAADLGLGLGDAIVSSHGLIETGDAERHAPFRVCGILQSCDGPYDKAIFVPLPAIWDEHDHAHDGEHEDGREATAVIVRPAGYAEAYELFAEHQRGKEAALVFPAQVVVRLLSMLGQAEWVFKAAGLAAGLLAAAIVALVLYWSACDRREELRILGLLGAEKADRLIMVLTEGLLAVLPGIAVGFAVGRLALFGLGGAIRARTALAVATGMSPLDVGLIAVLVASGLLGGLWGGWRALAD